MKVYSLRPDIPDYLRRNPQEIKKKWEQTRSDVKKVIRDNHNEVERSKTGGGVPDFKKLNSGQEIFVQHLILHSSTSDESTLNPDGKIPSTLATVTDDLRPLSPLTPGSAQSQAQGGQPSAGTPGTTLTPTCTVAVQTVDEADGVDTRTAIKSNRTVTRDKRDVEFTKMMNMENQNMDLVENNNLLKEQNIIFKGLLDIATEFVTIFKNRI